MRVEMRARRTVRRATFSSACGSVACARLR